MNDQTNVHDFRPDLTARYADQIEAFLAANGVEVKKRMTHPIHILEHWTGVSDDIVPVMARSFKTSKTDLMVGLIDYVKKNDIRVVALYEVIGPWIRASTETGVVDPITFVEARKMTQEEADRHNDEMIVRGYFGTRMPSLDDVSTKFVAQSNVDFQG